MFVESKPTCSTLELTKELAQEIYAEMVTNGSVTATFTAPETNFDYTNIIKVDREADRLFAEINSKMGGGFLITPYIPAVTNGDEIITPAIEAVYFIPTTEEALVSSLSDTLLDGTKLVADCIKYSNSENWTEYKSSFEG